MDDIERFEGNIHDRVRLSDSEVTIIGPVDAGDSVGFQIHAGGVSIGIILQRAEASRIAQILMAAATDNLGKAA